MFIHSRPIQINIKLFPLSAFMFINTYGSTIGWRMSLMYRKAVSAHSMTTSGVRRPHIMPLQNIRKPPPCCTRWTLFRRRSAWPGCLQTRSRRLSGWRNMLHSSLKRTWCQFRGVHSACCWAHLYRAAWCRGCKDGPRHGRQEWIYASCSLLRTVWVVIRRPVAARKALFIIQHGGVAVRVLPSWNPYIAVIHWPLGGQSEACHQQFLYLCTSSMSNHSERYTPNRRWGGGQSGPTVP